MNKTVTINISGIIFHIEEDAYERLQSYLNSLRGRFSAEEGRDEIMMDIESRIAEILNERISPSKQVLVMADVDHVISLMGEPEVISENDNASSSENEKEKEKEREEEYRAYRRRRLYRDTDDRVIGGICSGLGYYFDVDPVWIRIGFVLLAFAFGSSVLFYLLLMIIVPKAETTAEKLEMRGEAVDVNNISKTIREEFEGFRKRMEDFGDEAKAYGRKWKRTWRGEMRDRERRYSKEWKRYDRDYSRGGIDGFFHGVFRVFGKLFAFALVFFGVLFLIGLLTSAFSMTDLGPEVVSANFRNVFSSDFYYDMAIWAFLLVFGIPVLMMIYKGARLMFNMRFPDRVVGFSALGVWVIGVVLGVLAMVNAGRSFASEATIHEMVPLHLTAKDTVYLRVNIDKDMLNQDYHSRFNKSHHVYFNWKVVSMNGQDLKLGYPKLNIVPAAGDSVELVIYKSSHGRDQKEAQLNAEGIRYPVTVKDSLITFTNCFTLNEQYRWRAPEVHAELRLPVGCVVYLYSSLDGMLNDIDNVNRTSDDDMTSRRWKMTDRGLACIDCAGLGMDEETPASDSLKKKDSVVIKH